MKVFILSHSRNPIIAYHCPPVCHCGLAKKRTRIVGGVESEVNEWPWQVSFIIQPKTINTSVKEICRKNTQIKKRIPFHPLFVSS